MTRAGGRNCKISELFIPGVQGWFVIQKINVFLCISCHIHELEGIIDISVFSPKLIYRFNRISVKISDCFFGFFFFFFFGKKLKCKLTTCKIMVFLCPLPAAAKLLQSCPTLCDPIDGSSPGSAIPGILQARILKWVAISFSTLPPSSC